MAPLAVAWVFAGSEFYTHPETKERMYAASEGDLITVANFTKRHPRRAHPSSSDSDNERVYVANTANIPPQGTFVTMYLRPMPAQPAKGAVAEKNAGEPGQGRARPGSHRKAPGEDHRRRLTGPSRPIRRQRRLNPTGRNRRWLGGPRREPRRGQAPGSRRDGSPVRVRDRRRRLAAVAGRPCRLGQQPGRLPDPITDDSQLPPCPRPIRRSRSRPTRPPAIAPCRSTWPPPCGLRRPTADRRLGPGERLVAEGATDRARVFWVPSLNLGPTTSATTAAGPTSTRGS
ncbi:MAG: hypothetical protein U0790_00800 [Isosphaeraceae bacterium]